MTTSEFKNFIEGFVAANGEFPPTTEQWKMILEKIRNLDPPPNIRPYDGSGTWRDDGTIIWPVSEPYIRD